MSREMRTIIRVITIFTIIFLTYFLGLHLGAQRALQSNGRLYGNEFIIEYDGNLYVWDVK